MTKPARNRILKDVNGTNRDHHRNHIHLTNCIHLKNHMHKQSPILTNRSLMRDLAVLQRSKSLRDPSASPPSCHSPSVGREESSGADPENGLRDGFKDFIHESIYGSSQHKMVKQSRRHGGGDDHVKTLSEKLNELSLDGDDAASSHIHGRPKKHKVRRCRASVACRDPIGENEVSVASNSFDNKKVSRAPKNGCGIPWNWSRIHHRGKSFLDQAGKSLYCGISECENIQENADNALPLLDPSGSQESAHNAARVRFQDSSGELGIFAENLLNHEMDSDLVSEARFGKSRHRSLTQKYMPRTFRDVVGQNLVAQALSNAVAKRKVGLLYVFYGPNGTGKTSCARIFARALTCQSPDHSKPCGACNSCVSYDMGNSLNIREIGAEFENIMDLLGMMTISRFPSQYRIIIFDDCDNLAPRCWTAVLKVTDRAPRGVVFILVCSSLDALPHIIVSRSQKFFFPKLKDADIVCTLRCIATKEDIEIDKDALKLIATRSEGSLRDAEMTLEQLSLLGRRISVPLVQELVGLISDEKLVDLLDLALSADTVNTVKSLREIMESGVEPLAFMSQLATVIADILAGSYDFSKEKSRRKFFRRHALSKDDMEKLRQALKTLSEAEKQLRVSTDRLTWLTAALLQLAPDQQYRLPSSSADTSLNQSPLGLSYGGAERELFTTVGRENLQIGSSSNNYNSGDRKQSGRQEYAKYQNRITDLWLDMLKRIKIASLKEFLYQEGKLTSVRFGAAPKVRLVFRSHVTRAKAERFRAYILQALESVLGSPVTVEIRCESRKGSRGAGSAIFPTSHDGGGNEREAALMGFGSTTGVGTNEIVELESAPSPREAKHGGRVDVLEVRNSGNRNQNMSLVRGKVSLAHVLQRAEGGWSQRKAVSIAEKLEQENLRLEPRSRSLLCWKSTRVSPRKLTRLKMKRRPKALLKLVSCGKCLSGRSSR